MSIRFYSAMKLTFRFSMKASGPSMASFERIAAAAILFSIAKAACIERPLVRSAPCAGEHGNACTSIIPKVAPCGRHSCNHLRAEPTTRLWTVHC